MTSRPNELFDPLEDAICRLIFTNKDFKHAMRPLIAKDGWIVGLTYRRSNRIVYHYSDDILDLYYSFMEKIVPVPEIPERLQHG